MKIVLGGILIAVGVLIAGATGLCCVMVLANAGAITGPMAFVSVGIYGAIPFAAGIGLILGGQSLIRDARRNGRGAE